MAKDGKTKVDVDGRLLGFFGDRFHKNVFLICLLTSVGLIVASFVTPPMWIIDGSILAAVGELFGFAALAEVAAAIERGHSATISHGNTSIEIRKEEGEPEGDQESGE
jgi:hypothetical protein